ncbi:hypothetical protein QBC47DRAFT_385175 [Echria macrotheca]|uniref:Thioesterase n=1 Tax=Echria macrotheca TaxID=438768 RepID=A0AAJ0BAT2_9PEZI|nr:hypothetical protein QBC47DRAFT_385175 [Echria macrotheca]
MAPKKQDEIDPLEASSYHHPNGGAMYAPLRDKIVQTATEMGYDVPTMTEHKVIWADDQDPFGHVANPSFAHWSAVTGFRMFESFAAQLKDKYDDLLKARGIGVVVKSFETDIRRQVKYPDSVIVAARLMEVKPDRYYSITTMWSLRQQAIVAQTQGYVVFFDFAKQRPANLIEAGGVYADLHAALSERAQKSTELAAEWERRNPSKSRGKKPRL